MSVDTYSAIHEFDGELVYPAHLQRHRDFYEAHQAGATYKELANRDGISITRAAQIVQRWARWLEQHDPAV